MIRCLISGTLHDAPQARTGSNGNPFTTCKVKADDKAGAWVWVNAIVFGEAAQRLLSLKAGDSVSLSGRAELSVWTDKEGNARPSLSLVADEIAALRAKPKPKDAASPPKARPSSARLAVAPAFDDLDTWTP